jgi:hypothetical protein
MEEVKTKVLDHLVMVNLDIHIWSARTKLLPLDLNGAELPPEDLASLGSKRICNPEALNAFAAVKARAVSLLEKSGVRFLGCWAVPETRIEEISGELSVCRNEFNRLKEDFLQRYDQVVQDWITAHPQWGSIIAGSTVDAEHVRSRLDFRWQMFRVEAPAGKTELGDNLLEDVAALGGTLFEEIARAAREAWKKCFEGKTEITRKALSPLKSIYDKLMGLTFVEPHVLPTAELLAAALTGVPKRGPVTGQTLLILQGLVSLLGNPQALREHTQKIIDGREQHEEVLSGFLKEMPALDYEVEPVFAEEPPPLIESHGLW